MLGYSGLTPKKREDVAARIQIRGKVNTSPRPSRSSEPNQPFNIGYSEISPVDCGGSVSTGHVFPRRCAATELRTPEGGSQQRTEAFSKRAVIAMKSGKKQNKQGTTMSLNPRIARTPNSRRPSSQAGVARGKGTRTQPILSIVQVPLVPEENAPVFQQAPLDFRHDFRLLGCGGQIHARNECATCSGELLDVDVTIGRRV